MQKGSLEHKGRSDVNDQTKRTNDRFQRIVLAMGMVSFSEDGAIDYNKMLMEDISLFQISRGGLQ